MRFLIDNNVPAAVPEFLNSRGHDVALVRIVLSHDAPDPLVATTAMEQGRILVSHDRDMKRIERAISNGFKDRYPRLCRLQLCCDEVQSAQRLAAFIDLIELEFSTIEEQTVPLLVDIGDHRARFAR